MGIKDLRNKLEQQKGKRDVIQARITKLKKQSRSLKKELIIAEKARIVIQTTAKKTQEELQYQLSELPKLALSGVFDNPYDFQIEFELRRGKTEADFWFIRDDIKFNPKNNTGLGSVDIAGVALRPSLWSLRRPRNRPTIFLDEPLKHLKGIERNIRALAMLKEICTPRPEQNWPGIQIIMIADERAPREELAQVADKMFEFNMKNKITSVKEVER